MKKICYLAAISALLFASCERKTQGNPYELKAGPQSLTFAAAGAAAQRVAVVAKNVKWDAVPETGAAWLHVERGEDGVSVSVDDNSGSDVRQATLTITSDVKSCPAVQVAVRQEGNANGTAYRSAMGQYWGDYYNVGALNIGLAIYTGEFDKDGDPVVDGPGHIIFLDMLSEMPAEGEIPELTPGRYVVNDSYEKFTAVAGDGVLRDEEIAGSAVLYFEGDGDGEFSCKGVSGGGFTIEEEGEGYIVMLDLQLSDGSTLRGSYRGEINIEGLTQTLSNLDEDLILDEKLNAGLIGFMGDGFENGTHLWHVYIYNTPDVLIDEGGYLCGNGHLMDIGFVSTQQGDGQLMPAGTYVIGDSHKAGTVLVGKEDSPSWYIEVVDDLLFGGKFAPLCSGKIEVGYSGGIYTLKIAAKEDRGFNISAEFEGRLEYFDLTQIESGAPFESPLSVKPPFALRKPAPGVRSPFRPDSESKKMPLRQVAKWKYMTGNHRF